MTQENVAGMKREIDALKAKLKAERASTLPRGTVSLTEAPDGIVCLKLDSTGPVLGVSKNGNEHLVKAIGQKFGSNGLFLTYTLGRMVEKT